jgi:hypothetical protein
VVEQVLNDSYFGDLTACSDAVAGVFSVTGEHVPEVVLRRTDHEPLDDLIPVRTRDAARLTLTVGGEPAVVIPARGRISRRSYSVDAVHAGVIYRLVPCSSSHSRLLIDGTKTGKVEAFGEGTAHAEWSVRPAPGAAAIAYVLANAFGTGGQPFYENAIDLVTELIP